MYKRVIKCNRSWRILYILVINNVIKNKNNIDHKALRIPKFGRLIFYKINKVTQIVKNLYYLIFFILIFENNYRKTF